MRIEVPLSELSAGRRNPRRVQPQRDAHRRLVASIRAVGLLQPLLVRAIPEAEGYRVVAGKRRLEALRAVHRGTGTDPLVACELKEVDDTTADGMALAENFVREGMHPLDEAEAFARLAIHEDRGVAGAAAEFGVETRYVKQRMKLAALAPSLKDAYRHDAIDTGTAEVFAAIPTERQEAIWAEVHGNVRDIHHARSLIQDAWIDARHARFDPDTLVDRAVSRDLFGDRVLIEREAFMSAQAAALVRESDALAEDGWGEVVVASRNDAYDRLCRLDHPETEYDQPTQTKLAEITREIDEVDRAIEALDDDANEETYQPLYDRSEALEEQYREVADDAEPVYSEAVKAVGTMFLLLDPGGQVQQEVRIPRQQRTGHTQTTGEATEAPKPPTSEDLSDRQKEAAYVHETLAVRSALLHDYADRTRRVLLVLMLAEGVYRDGLLARAESDPVGRYVQNRPEDKGPFVSEAWDQINQEDAERNPFAKTMGTDPVKAYQRLMKLDDAQLNGLIDLLIVQRVAGSLQHHTALIARLVQDLGVQLRDYWTPNAEWFASYKKIQLAQLIGKLRGKTHGTAAERMKKTELVNALDSLFADARDGKLDDPAVAERVNAWVPSCVRPKKSKAGPAATSKQAA